MARPKKPGDPAAWPDPCARCNEHYQPVARWPDGRICGYCYQAAKRERGTCMCGHNGVLPGRIDGRAACRSCSGVALNVDCVTCGAEAELYRGGRCMHCELNLVVELLLTDPATGKIAPELVAISEAMKNMKRANSGLTWIKQRHVREFFKQLRGHGQVTHELLDTLPPSRTRDYVRGLLVEHGALPRHDLYRGRFNEWIPGAIDRLDHPDDRDVITRFTRWHVLRRMNDDEATSRGTFLRSKQTVTVAIDILTWCELEEFSSRTSLNPTWTTGKPEGPPHEESQAGSSAGPASPGSSIRIFGSRRIGAAPAPSSTQPPRLRRSMTTSTALRCPCDTEPSRSFSLSSVNRSNDYSP